MDAITAAHFGDLQMIDSTSVRYKDAFANIPPYESTT